MDLPDISDPVFRRRVLAVSAVAGAVLALACFYATDLGLGVSFSLLSLPVLVLGAIDMVSKRSWVRIAASSVMAVLACLVSMDAAVAMLLLGFGSAGVSVLSDMACRRFMPSALRTIEHAGYGRARTVERFLVGIPGGLDTRDMRLDCTVRRESVPWGLRTSAVLISAGLMLIVWIAAAASGLGSDDVSVLMTVSVYLVALVVPWTVLSTADVRVCAPGIDHRLYDGFLKTAATALVPLIVALAVVCIAVMPDASTFWLIGTSFVFLVAEAYLSMIRFEEAAEADLVRDLSDDWGSDHPVLLYSGLDGRTARHGDDGVPGTPRRSEDSCFPARRVRSIEVGVLPAGGAEGVEDRPEDLSGREALGLVEPDDLRLLVVGDDDVVLLAGVVYRHAGDLLDGPAEDGQDGVGHGLDLLRGDVLGDPDEERVDLVDGVEHVRHIGSAQDVQEVGLLLVLGVRELGDALLEHGRELHVQGLLAQDAEHARSFPAS